MKLYLIVFAVAGLIVSTSLPATAQLGPGESDKLLIFQNGTPAGTLPISETSEINVVTAATTILNSVNPAGNTALFGSYTVLTEPDGSISDVFGVVSFPGSPLGIGYSSAPESGMTTVPSFFINPSGAGTPITLPEGNGGPFDATMYLNPILQQQGFTATFQSDAETVPEPSTLTLLALGGVGLIRQAYRRRRQKIAFR
jgi:PEP-CTERM motif